MDGVTWGVFLLCAWTAATIALLTRLAVTFLYGAHLVRRAHRQACEPMQKIADTAATRFGVLHGLQVRASDRIQSPVVWCWARPSILLVPGGCQDGQTDWAGVLAHELAHCKRRDHLTGLLAELAVSLLPWNPLMWLSRRQLIRLGEEACDDWVVATGHSSEDYAESLLRFRPQRRMAFVPAVVHSRVGVAARVRRILSAACSNPRMGTRWALGTSVLATCVAVGVAFAQTRPVEPVAITAGQPIELRYSVFFSSVNRQFAPTVLWAKMVETRTNGRVRITISDNGSLTPPERCYEGVVKGNSDLGVAYFAHTPGRFPLLEGLDLPLGYPSGAVATRVAMELTEKYKAAEVADTHLLYVYSSGPGLLASKKPVRTLDDVKGMKIRTAALQGKIASALGGTPVDVPWNTTYDGLRWDIVDATLCPMETLVRLRLGEVISSITETPAIAYSSTLFVTMNLKKWQSLPPDIQEVFTAVSREWAAKHGQAWDQADAAGRAFVEGLNREIISLSPEEQQRWKQAARPVLDAYVKATNDKGLPGEQFLKDAQDLIAKYSEPVGP
jgi:TRAP-type C4-dicarboxylate transport system substrate-binding protein